MAEKTNDIESDVGDIIARLDGVEDAYALKIQEYCALINVKNRISGSSADLTRHVDVIRIPDMVHRPRRAA